MIERRPWAMAWALAAVMTMAVGPARAQSPLLELLSGNAFSPKSVAGLSFWHDASKAASVTLNVSDVAQINDQSGNGRDAVQGTGANQPAYASTTINGRNVITFTGANSDALVLGSALTAARNVAGYTVCGVARITSLAAAGRLFTIFNSTTATRFSISHAITTGRISTSSRRLDADSSITNTATATAFAANTASFFCVGLDYANGAGTLLIDGASEAVAPAWAGGNGNTSDTNSGSGPIIGTSTNALTGDIAEIAGWAKFLSAAQMSQLRLNYFKPKWATP